jgi:hypothetical protein
MLLAGSKTATGAGVENIQVRKVPHMRIFENARGGK